MDAMDNVEYGRIVEAILFAHGEPVPVKTLCEALSLEEDRVREIVLHLSGTPGGILIREISGGFQMCTNPEYHEHVRKTMEKSDGRSLSQAAYETLSIIAYNGTATRAKIESVRGVNSGSSLMTLMEKGLIEEKGRVEAPGRPVIYGVTEEFLRAFDMKTLEDLLPVEMPEDFPEEEENS
ncbi:MAG: SMC-Scp complex subunit ScpB [Clostridia bacterium]